MGLNLPTANQGGSAPEVEDGITLLRFDDLQQKSHADWAGTDSFGHPDDGERFHFLFTLCDDDKTVVYNEEGDPIELEAVTRTATGAKSNFAAILKGILTSAEFTLWEANEPFDGDKVQGRFVLGTIEHSKKGWPQVAATHGAPKSKGAK